MLDVKYFPQKTGFCGPTALKMTLDYYGVKASAEKLAELSGCTPEKGVGAEGILKAAKHFGLNGFVKDLADFKDIETYVKEKKVPLIVDWFSTDEGHYSIVVDIDDNFIYLRDPLYRSIQKMERVIFKRVWFDFSSDFLRSKDDLILRRIIVVSR